ncbi:MAG: hypothetical protein ACE5NP_09995 [Anaerolineae bacterium]
MIRKFFAFVFAVIFILVTPLTLFAFDLRSVLLNPDFYKQELTRYGIYDKLFDMVAEEVKGLAQQEGLGVGEGLMLIPESEIMRLLRVVVPPDWVQEQAERALDQFFSWLRSDQDVPTIVIPLKEVKGKLVTQLERELERKVRQFPECEPGQQPEVGENGIPSCLPPGVDKSALLERFKPQLMGEANRLLQEIPDELNLVQLMREQAPGEGDGIIRVLAQLRRIIRIANLVLVAGVAGSVLLLILVAALAATSLRSVLAWVGSTLFVTGAVAFTPLLLLPDLVDSALTEALSGGGMEEVPPAMVNLATNIINDLVNAFLSPLRLQVLAMLALGALLIVLALALWLVEGARQRP